MSDFPPYRLPLTNAITFYETSHPLHSTAHRTSNKHGPPCLYCKIGACALKSTATVSGVRPLSRGEGNVWKTRKGNIYTQVYHADICVHTVFVYFYFPHVFLLVFTFCVVMLCHCSSSSWRFDESYCLHLQSSSAREEFERSVTTCQRQSIASPDTCIFNNDSDGTTNFGYPLFVWKSNEENIRFNKNQDGCLIIRTNEEIDLQIKRGDILRYRRAQRLDVLGML